jgi:hypothetical protein
VHPACGCQPIGAGLSRPAIRACSDCCVRSAIRYCITSWCIFSTSLCSFRRVRNITEEVSGRPGSNMSMPFASLNWDRRFLWQGGTQHIVSSSNSSSTTKRQDAPCVRECQTTAAACMNGWMHDISNARAGRGAWCVAHLNTGCSSSRAWTEFWG